MTTEPCPASLVKLLKHDDNNNPIVDYNHLTNWHTDFQENLTLQLRGKKKWRLKQGSVKHPLRGRLIIYDLILSSTSFRILTSNSDGQMVVKALWTTLGSLWTK